MKMSKLHLEPIIFVTVIILIMVASLVPFKITKEVLNRDEITGNYIFAFDIDYKGERVGASAELCTYLLFHPEAKEIHVITKKALFFVRRFPDPDFHPIKADRQSFSKTGANILAAE